MDSQESKFEAIKRSLPALSRDELKPMFIELYKMKPDLAEDEFYSAEATYPCQESAVPNLTLPSILGTLPDLNYAEIEVLRMMALWQYTGDDTPYHIKASTGNGYGGMCAGINAPSATHIYAKPIENPQQVDSFVEALFDAMERENWGEAERLLEQI